MIKNFTSIGIRINEFIRNLRKIKSTNEGLFREHKNIQRDLLEIKKGIEEDKIDLQNKERAFLKLCEEKTTGFPWFEEKVSEFHYYYDLKLAKELLNKKRPARVASEKIKEIASEKRNLQKKYKIACNQLKYIENLFPWILDYVDDGIDEIILMSKNTVQKGLVEKDDPVLKYMKRPEYEKLDVSTRNQMALDRYLKSRKSNWEIGRDYERYVGYIYESEGYDVNYFGIFEGLEDFGRDLICQKGDKIEIIQCKCWAKYKVIHEKHINQLFGTTMKYLIQNKEIIRRELDLFSNLNVNYGVKPVFITTTNLSSTAREFADMLNVEIKENFSFKKYPTIKCNVSDATNDKIYHLPFDQQYDKIKMTGKKHNFYANSVREAEERGFRRAYRWKGIKNGR